MKMEMTPQDNELVRKALEGAGFYQHLSQEEFRKLLKAFDKVGIRKGEELINQGTVGKVFYLLSSGSVGVYRKRQIMDIQVATLGPGAYFGEMALLTNSPREAAVKVLEDGVVFTLLQDSFHDILMRNPHVSHMIRQAVKDREKATRELERKERLERISGDKDRP